MKSYLLPIERIFETGVMAAARIPSAEDAVNVVDALAEGGVIVTAFSMAMADALQAIEKVSTKRYSNISVGAGTVLDSESARMAILAGAEFIVSPTINVEVIKVSHRYGVPILPGALTPNEILYAFELGCPIVKVFPGGDLGSAYIKSLLGPFKHIPLMPDGGVTLENAMDLIRAGGAALGIGGSLVNSKAVARKDFQQLTESADKFTTFVAQARKEMES
jgi:2-dehydro-3-deoxyphosphogluconate aldolase/(4S)-4-hydroxy-2-oxoglutarate aldolase